MSEIYYVVNSVRSIHTRLARTQAPARHRFKQFILGGTTRLVRGRPVAITAKQLKDYHGELKQKVADGAILIREGSPDGPLYSFSEKPIDKMEEKRKAKAEEEEAELAKKEAKEEEEMPPPPPPPSTSKKKKGKKSK